MWDLRRTKPGAFDHNVDFKLDVIHQEIVFRLHQLDRQVGQTGGKIVVHPNLVRKAEQFAALYGWDSYHHNVPHKKRRLIDFRSPSGVRIVARSAFGMGIDILNI